MKLHKVAKKATFVIVAGIALALLAPITSSSANSVAGITLGISADYALVSSGALTIGAGATFAGTGHSEDAAVQAVQTAYNYILDIPGSDSMTAEIGGQTFHPGVYDIPADAALDINASVTLNGGGDLHSVFIFRSVGAITTTASITISTINGAQPAHIFWISHAAITTKCANRFAGNCCPKSRANIDVRHIKRCLVVWDIPH